MLLFNLRERGVECGVSVSVLRIVGAERSEGKGRGGEAGRHGVPLRNGPSLRRRKEGRRLPSGIPWRCRSTGTTKPRTRAHETPNRQEAKLGEIEGGISVRDMRKRGKGVSWIEN